MGLWLCRDCLALRALSGQSALLTWLFLEDRAVPMSLQSHRVQGA